MSGIVAALHAVVSIGLTFLILLHSGKGSGMSEMFGGGMQQLGGTTTVEKNLDRITVVVVVLFTISTFALAIVWR